MPDNKAIELFNELFNNSNLRWDATAEPGTYAVPIGGKYVLKAFGYTNVTEDGIPSIGLYENEKLIVDISVTTGFALEALKEMYNRINRRALGTDLKIDEVLGELRKLK